MRRTRFKSHSARWGLRQDRRVHPHDILAIPPLAASFFWLPIFAIAVTGYASVAGDVRTTVWTACCLLMATGSLINEIRCGRLQCSLLTPLFTAGALASLAYGTGLWPLGAAGWGIIGYALFAGVVVISSVPELFLGRYR